MSVGVELDQPTAAHTTVHRERGERLTQRQLGSGFDVRNVLSAGARDDSLRAIADDDIHRLRGTQLAGRCRHDLGCRDPAHVIDIAVVIIERQSVIDQAAILTECGGCGGKATSNTVLLV